MKPRTKQIDVPIFGTQVTMIFAASTIKKFDKAISRYAIRPFIDADDLRDSHGFCTQHGPLIIAVQRSGVARGTVAHECYHAANRILRIVGVENPDEEVVAYLLGYLYREFMELVND